MRLRYHRDGLHDLRVRDLRDHRGRHLDRRVHRIRHDHRVRHRGHQSYWRPWRASEQDSDALASLLGSDDVRHLDAQKSDGFQRACCHRDRHHRASDPAWGRNRRGEDLQIRLDVVLRSHPDAGQHFHRGVVEAQGAPNRMRMDC